MPSRLAEVVPFLGLCTNCNHAKRNGKDLICTNELIVMRTPLTTWATNETVEVKGHLYPPPGHGCTSWEKREK
jgi:hypothetical protein